MGKEAEKLHRPNKTERGVYTDETLVNQLKLPMNLESPDVGSRHRNQTLKEAFAKGPQPQPTKG